MRNLVKKTSTSLVLLDIDVGIEIADNVFEADKLSKL